MAATVTDDGTEADEESELESVTTVPDGPALPFNLTEPTTATADPPATELGDTATDRTPAGKRVRLHVFVVAPSVAVIVTNRFESTPEVVTEKFAVDEPAGTVTDDGTTTLPLFELNDTTVPPVGAGAFNVTVPVGELPPTIWSWEVYTLRRPLGLTVRAAVDDFPCAVAVKVAVC